MSKPTPIATPAGYASAVSVGYSDTNQGLVMVSESDRLPVAAAAPPPAPLQGQASASEVAGPFAAVADRVVNVMLDGSWDGAVRLLRSTDGGATKQALRVAGQPWANYTEPAFEQAWLESEDGATYYLDIQLTSGTLTFRVSQ